jgi:hypothetical protein
LFLIFLVPEPPILDIAASLNTSEPGKVYTLKKLSYSHLISIKLFCQVICHRPAPASGFTCAPRPPVGLYALRASIPEVGFQTLPLVRQGRLAYAAGGGYAFTSITAVVVLPYSAGFRHLRYTSVYVSPRPAAYDITMACLRLFYAQEMIPESRTPSF